MTMNVALLTHESGPQPTQPIAISLADDSLNMAASMRSEYSAHATYRSEASEVLTTFGRLPTSIVKKYRESQLVQQIS